MTTFRLKRSTTAYQFGALLMVASAACWGIGTVMSKSALSVIPPFTLLAVQLIASVIALWLATLIRREQPLFRWPVIRLGWTGMLEPGLAYILGLIGLSVTSASSASFIMALEPFAIIILAWLLLKERLLMRSLFLMLLALIGVLLISATAEGEGVVHSLWGDLLVLAGTVSAALYVVFSSRSVTRLAPMPLAALQQSAGLLFALLVLPFGLLNGEGQLLQAVPVSAWLWAMLNGVVQYTLAFSLYLYALQRIPATTAAPFLTLIPIFGVLGSVLFLGESFTPLQLIGGSLILAALFILHSQRTQSVESHK